MAQPGGHGRSRLTDRFDEAFLLASSLHRRQRRKGSGAPYLSHLMIVSGLTLTAGADEDTAIAALLHDAIEDQGGDATLGRIREQFGDRVARIIEGCSDSFTDGPKRPWRERKEAHIARVPHESPDVWMVLAADKLHNTRSILADYYHDGDAVWDVFSGRRDGTLWYTHAMTDALVAVAPELPLVQELVRTVAELDRALAARGSVEERP